MLSPIHVTGVPVIDWFLFVGGLVVGVYWLRALRLARDGARRFLRNGIKAFLLFCGLAAVLSLMRAKTHWVYQQEQIAAGFAAFLFFARWQKKKRSRHIPKAVRRAVIQRDLKGQEFDSEKYHIDHVWPHSKGGSNTADNLRVLEKSKNLKKGAKRPRIREMW